MSRRTRRHVTVVSAVVAVLAVALPALAYWTFAPSRSTTFTTATLGAPSVTVPAYSSGTVSVTWNAVTAPGGGAVDGYYVQRVAGATTTAVCGSAASPITALSCTDTVGAGSYAYRVTAVDGSWSTPALSSAVVIDTTPAAFAVSGVTGSNIGTDGTAVYFKPTGTQTFTLTAVDAESGVAGTPSFPAFLGWSTPAASGPSLTYTRGVAATSLTGSGSITNGAGLTATPSVSTVAQLVSFAAADVQGIGDGDGKPDTGDKVVLTFGAVVNPSTLITGWDGTSKVVQFAVTGNGNSTGTVLSSNVGTVGMGAQYKANGSCTTCTLDATIVLATVSGRSVATITFTSDAAGLNASSGNKTMTFAQSPNVRDWGGNTPLTTTVNETGGGDADF